MKTKINLCLKQEASAIIVSLFLMTILAVSIGGYMYYVQQQTSLGARAQSWNAALAVAEAGVEEGLQALNGGMSVATGWSANGSIYTITRTNSDGSSYTVTNDVSVVNSPTVTARGYISMPTLVLNAPSYFFAAVGVNSSSSKQVTRAIQVKTTRNSLFLAAMVAKHKIDMNGNNVSADSYDSTDSSKSTGGRYDATKAGDYGDVASNDGVVNAVSLGNANIYGHVSTGPGGTIQLGNLGGVGTHAWQAANGSTPQPGYELDNANFTFPEVDLPYNSGSSAGPGDIVSISGSNSVSTTYVNMPNPPGALSAGQTLGPISTNCAPATTNGYPGQLPGLTTNTTWVTSTTYPGNISGLVSNCVGYTTVTTYPGVRQCMSTNCSGTAVKVKDKPAVGVYCGTAPWQGSGNDNNWWFYYPIASYTYANQFSYTYPTYTYGYTLCTYTYTIYQGVPTYTTNTYQHVLTSGNYYDTSSFSGSTYVSGTATLVLPNGLNMSGSDTITIANGAALTIYSGNDATVKGQGIVNVGGLPSSFILYSKGDDFTLDGNGTFTGILVAPYANIRLNGGGSGTDDFSGALLGNKITLNGHFKFHYDQALGRMGGSGRYLITSWNEIN